MVEEIAENQRSPKISAREKLCMEFQPNPFSLMGGGLLREACWVSKEVLKTFTVWLQVMQYAR